MRSDLRHVMVRRVVAIFLLGGVLPLLTLSVPGLAEVLFGAGTLVIAAVAAIVLWQGWPRDAS